MGKEDKAEITKQLEAGFLKVVQYPEWLANIVPVPKKDGKVRMCVDYRDLNKACPKDDFPLPHIDLLVDRMAGHETAFLTDLAVRVQPNNDVSSRQRENGLHHGMGHLLL